MINVCETYMVMMGKLMVMINMVNMMMVLTRMPAAMVPRRLAGFRMKRSPDEGPATCRGLPLPVQGGGASLRGETQGAPMILFENATLLDGHADHALPGMHVLVEGGMIREVSDSFL